MSSVAVADLDKNKVAELCCTYAALILHDEGLEVSSAQLEKLINASGNKIDGFWLSIFSKALAGKNIGDMLAGGAAPAGGEQQQSAGPAEQKKEEKKEEKVEEEEEEDVDMGDLFGDF